MTIKHAGIALIIGVVLSFVSGLLFPGNALIDPVNQLDYSEAVGAIAGAPNLAHTMLFISILGMLLIVFGFVVGIYPLTAQQAGVGNTLLRFGIILSVIEWSIVIIGQGMRHIVVHLMQRSAAAAGSEEATLFSDIAFDVYVNMIAVFMSFIPLFPIASILVGIGLVSRIPTTNLSKLSAYGLVVIGIVGFIVYVAAMFAPADDPQIYLTTFNVILFAGAVLFAVLGYGMVKGDDGLTDES